MAGSLCIIIVITNSDEFIELGRTGKLSEQSEWQFDYTFLFDKGELSAFVALVFDGISICGD